MVKEDHDKENHGAAKNTCKISAVEMRDGTKFRISEQVIVNANS